jgi:hypothetical protein
MGKLHAFGISCRKLKMERPKLTMGVTLPKTREGKMPTTALLADFTISESAYARGKTKNKERLTRTN